MQLTHHHHAERTDGLLTLTWKTMAGLAAAIGLIFLGTVVVESTLPQLPDQARASVRQPAPETSVSAVLSRAAEPVRVEHFHTQFRLEPGTDSVPQAETF